MTAPGQQEMVTLTIEGREVTVPKGTTILEAAKRVGIVIPHYCYHPSLPIAGVCRMCLVEVEGVRNLQIGCHTQVGAGQDVRVYSDKALKARESVLEFLLINHPLDCPICDQAGECELQNYVFREGRPRTRYTPTYAKRFDPVEDFGPDILYVPNRCILCTRCVRFMEHVADDDVISVAERGDRAFIGIHPERQLDHPWAGNVVDLCPVGSLLSKDFLHKARAWEVDRTASVCTGCSQGCNIVLETRDNSVVRVHPRTNLAVNRYFMCDHGRLNYRGFNRGDRLEAPLIKDGAALVATDWDHVLERVAHIVKGSSGTAVALVSPSVSTEALFLLRQLLADFTVKGAFQAEQVAGEAPLPGVPGLALRSERAPNATAARLLGYTDDYAAALAALDGASVAIVLGELPSGVARETLQRAAHLIYLGTVLEDAVRGAAVVLPITHTVEEDGSFVNRDHRVQRYFQAKSGPGMARPGWWVLSELLAELGRGEPLSDAAHAFQLLAERESVFSGMSYETVGYGGALAARSSAAEVSA